MQKSVFVVMPYGTKEVRAFLPAQNGLSDAPPVQLNFDEIYRFLISPALLKADYKPFRADAEKAAGDIRTDMFYELVTADIVLADVSILNPNVFYELGIRHGVLPGGVITISGGWAKYPFDIAPDRTIVYDGALFAEQNRDQAWQKRLADEIEALSSSLKETIDADDQTIGSPLYKELPGLKPVDWSNITNAKAKYFGQIFVDWRARIRMAKRNGYPGDILTLADDAPTVFHRIQFLCEAARALIEMLRYEPALQVLEDLLELQPDHLDALAQKGLVLGRLNRTQQAQIHLAAVAEKYAGNPEVQGGLGRIYKDMWRFEWMDSNSVEKRREHALLASPALVSAIRSYNIALRKNLDSYYNGINVVSLVCILEFLKKAIGEDADDPQISDLNDVIGAVRMAANADLALARENNNDEDAVWPTASLAELELTVGDAQKSKALYRNAVNTPTISFFQLDSMLTQVRLFERLGYRDELVPDVVKIFEQRLSKLSKPQFRFDKIVLGSGHMIDSPERTMPRFPAEKEDIVRSKMEEQLDKWDVGSNDLAICGGARGSDILFAEICLKRKAQVWLLIALPLGEFLEQSVRLPGGDWENRFFQLEKDGARLFYQHERLGLPPKGVSPFPRTNLWIINSGMVEARAPAQLYALLVWDEKPPEDNKPGGTSEFASRVGNFGGRKEIINPTKL